MTDPIDHDPIDDGPIDDGRDGGRDDDYDWDDPQNGRDEPTTQEQLARLREGLSRERAVRGGGGRRPRPGQSRGDHRDDGRAARYDGPPAGGDLPGSLDRAIARVGGLLDDTGGRSSDGARDPYADFGDAEDDHRAPPAARGRGYDDDDMAEPAPRRESAADSRQQVRREAQRRGAGRRAGGYGARDDEDAAPDAEHTARDRRGGAPFRRERRAGRPRRTSQSFDDTLARGESDGYADDAHWREEDDFEGRSRRGRGATHRADAADDYREPEYAEPRRAGDDYPDARYESGFDEDGYDRGDAQGYDPDYEQDYEADARRPRREMRREMRQAEKSRGPKRSRGEPPMDPEEAAAQAQAMRGRGSAPFGSLERMIAGRYLRARRQEGFISVIAMLSLVGITLAVAVLIVVMSVMNGFRAELISKIVGVNGHLIVQPLDRGFDDYDAASRDLRAVAGVTRAAPMIEGQAFATSSRGGSGALVRGLSKSDLLSLQQVSVSPEYSVGSLANYGNVDGIALGAGLARKLGVSVGDTINVISPQGSVTPFGVAPKRRAFDVLYVFKMGMSNYDDALMFMPIEDAQTFFNRPGSADFIEVQVATPDQLDIYVEDIEDTIGRAVSVTSWKDSNSTFIGALETEQSVMFLILSMLILIASLIIISGLIMLVKEKGPDIAILRTMGFSRGGVMRVFFMCGATIGLLGVVVGVALGVIVALNVNDIKEFIEATTGAQLFPSEVYLFSALPSRLDWGDVSFTVMITLGLSFVATLYPAWRAARMDPVEALRYE